MRLTFSGLALAPVLAVVGLASALSACSGADAGSEAAPRAASWRDVELPDSLRPITPRSPLALANDTIVAVHAAGFGDSASFALISLSGVYLGRFGPKGQGPGEIMSAAEAFSGPEGVWVYDMVALRATAFDPAGIYGSQIQFAGPVFPAAVTQSGLVGLVMTATGALDVRSYVSRAAEGESVFGQSSSEDFQRLVAGPFAAAAPPEKLQLMPAITANDSLLVVGYPRRFLLYWFRRRDGTLIDSVSVPAEVNRPTPEMIARQRASLGGSQQGGLTGDQLERAVEGYATSELPHFFRYGALKFDAGGRLWVASYRADTVRLGRATPSGVDEWVTFPCQGFAGSWDLRGEIVVAGCLDGDLPGLRVVSLANE